MYISQLANLSVVAGITFCDWVPHIWEHERVIRLLHVEPVPGGSILQEIAHFLDPHFRLEYLSLDFRLLPADLLDANINSRYLLVSRLEKFQAQRVHQPGKDKAKAKHLLYCLQLCLVAVAVDKYVYIYQDTNQPVLLILYNFLNYLKKQPCLNIVEISVTQDKLISDLKLFRRIKRK